MTCISKGSGEGIASRRKGLFAGIDRTRGGEPKREVFTSPGSSSGELHQSLPPLSHQNCQYYSSTAMCSFTCACRQTAVLHAAHMDLCMKLSTVTGVQCDTDLKGPHTHTHELPQYSKAVNTSIYRQPQESCSQSWFQAKTEYPTPVSIHQAGETSHHDNQNPHSFVRMGWRQLWADPNTGTLFIITPVDHLKSRARLSPRQKATSLPDTEVYIRGAASTLTPTWLTSPPKFNNTPNQSY